MKFELRLLLSFTAFWPLTAAPVDCEYAEALPQCEKPLVRKEWRTLSCEERKSYISAVKCVMGKPVSAIKDVLPGATSRFEEFLGDHILQTDANHFVGHFYPWHRLLLWAYEKEIRDCGFTGAQPYWDWSLDANTRADMFKSPIFDPETGFGGNGEWVPGTLDDPEPGLTVTAEGVSKSMDDRSGGGCIPNGPFANLKIHMGPRDNVEYNEWCVRRDFVPSQFVNAANKSVVAEGMALPDFGYFSKITQDSLHNAGHLGVGGLYGTLTDVYSSPGDPIFFLHHTNLDRVWWSWQARNLRVRIQDMSGPLIPFDYTNEKGRNVTLHDTVYVGAGINMTVSIRDLMDVRNSLLCYTYDTLY